MKKFLLTIILTLPFSYNMAKTKTPASQLYQGTLVRPDGNNIIFTFELHKQLKRPVLYLLNGRERLKVDSVRITVDSVFIKMPLFESYFKAAINSNTWSGLWIKETSKGTQQMPFNARPAAIRFPLIKGIARYSITGRWQADFASDSGKAINAVAEFQQQGSNLTGSF